MLTALFAAALVSGAAVNVSDQAVAVISPSPPPAPATAPARSQPVEASGETMRVCRFETATGSNRRTRVCRDVPRQGVQDQATREFMRDHQRWTPEPSG
ncbi:hypothetical protein [Falsiroseomonas sp.]|jgi:hypothetical protein|uniref:hypothetical protein n=1 Tax=Falsiroseomonas sp. TaxID=2870721 RepID=UPI0027367AE3|nr:hypothetical protein [Falsiroseomonas sp.]MDP3416177.1 hypothetical protein [Falsiroseomonas sp.]